jgi:hypothetical protein
MDEIFGKHKARVERLMDATLALAEAAGARPPSILPPAPGGRGAPVIGPA